MYVEARHVDTRSFIADAHCNDNVIEGGYLREECASLYYPLDADLPHNDQAIL